LSVQPKLGLAAPPRVDDIISIKFMYEDLGRSGLEPKDMAAYPIQSVAGAVGAYVIPYSNPLMWRIRYDRKDNKYIQPRGIVGVWWPPHKDPTKLDTRTLYIIEGEKKAAAFCKRWPSLFAFGIGGAHMSLHKISSTARAVMPEIQSALSPGMEVHVVFDGDIQTKLGVQQAAINLQAALSTLHVALRVFRPPIAKGVDDWLVEMPDASLKDLVEVNVSSLEATRSTLYKNLNLTLGENDKPVINESNLTALLSNYYEGRALYDRRLGVIVDGEPLEGEAFEFDSVSYIQRYHFAHAPAPRINKSVSYMFHTHKCDLVQATVSSLAWDGRPRLDTWGSEYFETDSPALANEWGRLLMTGLGLRILDPGCKVDIVPILYGAQGIGKTTFFEDLSIIEGHKFYQALMNLSPDTSDANRTETIALQRSVIVDLGEGVVFNSRKTSTDTLKQKLTQAEDSFRQVYSPHITIVKRGFIFVGTTNRPDLLSDSTGSRRFLILQAQKIKKLPYPEKMQILAEVAHKQSELVHNAWWELKIDPASIEVPDDKAHITDAQERINSKYQKGDDFQDWLTAILEVGDCASIKSSGELFITARYLSARHRENMNVNMVSRILSSLSASPTFKFRLRTHRPRVPQLAFPAGHEIMYTDGIGNAQQMLNGYIVHAR